MAFLDIDSALRRDGRKLGTISFMPALNDTGIGCFGIMVDVRENSGAGSIPAAGNDIRAVNVTDCFNSGVKGGNLPQVKRAGGHNHNTGVGVPVDCIHR